MVCEESAGVDDGSDIGVGKDFGSRRHLTKPNKPRIIGDSMNPHPHAILPESAAHALALQVFACLIASPHLHPNNG
jgi:hypothetical protein